MSIERDSYYGVRGETENETEYQISDSISIPRAANSWKDNHIVYNQKETSRSSCTVHGPMGAYSDLTGYEFPLEERKAIWAKALALGASDEWGWHTNLAVDLVRNHINETRNCKTFKLNVDSEQFFKVLRLGYSVVVSYRGNLKFNEDKNDGILDELKFGISTYGHCLRIAYSAGDEYELIIDNYGGVSTHNTYKIPSANLKQLIRNSVFYRAGYVFIEDFVDKEPSIPLWLKGSWEKAVEKGVVGKDDNWEEVVMNGLQEKMFIKLGLLNKEEGNISLGRLLVILDRSGNL